MVVGTAHPVRAMEAPAKVLLPLSMGPALDTASHRAGGGEGTGLGLGLGGRRSPLQTSTEGMFMCVCVSGVCSKKRVAFVQSSVRMFRKTVFCGGGGVRAWAWVWEARRSPLLTSTKGM